MLEPSPSGPFNAVTATEVCFWSHQGFASGSSYSRPPEEVCPSLVGGDRRSRPVHLEFTEPSNPNRWKQPGLKLLSGAGVISCYPAHCFQAHCGGCKTICGGVRVAPTGGLTYSPSFTLQDSQSSKGEIFRAANEEVGSPTLKPLHTCRKMNIRNI